MNSSSSTAKSVVFVTNSTLENSGPAPGNPSFVDHKPIKDLRLGRSLPTLKLRAAAENPPGPSALSKPTMKEATRGNRMQPASTTSVVEGPTGSSALTEISNAKSSTAAAPQAAGSSKQRIMNSNKASDHPAEAPSLTSSSAIKQGASQTPMLKAQSNDPKARPVGTVTIDTMTNTPTCSPAPCQAGQIYTARNGSYDGADLVVSSNGSLTPISTTITLNGVTGTTTAGGSSQQTTTVTVNGQTYTIGGGGPTTLSGNINGQQITETRNNGTSTVSVGGTPITSCGYSSCSLASVNGATNPIDNRLYVGAGGTKQWPGKGATGSGVTNKWEPGRSIAHSPDIRLSGSPASDVLTSIRSNANGTYTQTDTWVEGNKEFERSQTYVPGKDGNFINMDADGASKILNDQTTVKTYSDDSWSDPPKVQRFNSSLSGDASSNQIDPTADRMMKDANAKLDAISQKNIDQQAEDDRKLMNSACPAGGCEGVSSNQPKDWDQQQADVDAFRQKTEQQLEAKQQLQGIPPAQLPSDVGSQSSGQLGSAGAMPAGGSGSGLEGKQNSSGATFRGGVEKFMASPKMEATLKVAPDVGKAAIENGGNLWGTLGTKLEPSLGGAVSKVGGVLIDAGIKSLDPDVYNGVKSIKQGVDMTNGKEWAPGYGMSSNNIKQLNQLLEGK